MSDKAWGAGFVRSLGVRLAGDVIGDVDERGDLIVGETLLLLLNAHHEPIPFTLPATRAQDRLLIHFGRPQTTRMRSRQKRSRPTC